MTALLILIYLAFISLGLPDAVLGAAWPQVRQALGLPLSYAGIASTVVCLGTIISSLNSVRLVRKFQTKGVTLISVGLTALALLGYAQSQSFWWLCLMCVPLGLGAGSIDAALNNFVALHYKARQMSWLHCFWGVGATAGPVILAGFMKAENGWRGGALLIAGVQMALFVLLAVTLPIWKRAEVRIEHEEEAPLLSNRDAFRISGVKTAAFGFFCYCSAEVTAGLWASSYFVETKGFSVSEAAGFASFYYIGIAIGRFITGLLTARFNSKQLIRAGTMLCVMGGICMLLPLPRVVSAAGLLLIGLGCAPVYPCMLHETPTRFGKGGSQAVMGLQMACAYVGSLATPLLFGWLGQTFFMGLYPLFLLCFFGLLLFACERINICLPNGQKRGEE